MKVAQISLVLAWRNLWRNHRRTIIMLAAISVGAWAMIFMTALMRGMVNDMLREGIRALPGHVQVHNPAFRDDPSVNSLLSLTDDEINESLVAAGISDFAARVKVPAIISSERESRGITLLGVDPAGEQAVGAMGSDIAAGRGVGSVDDTGVVIGRRLAEKLETDIGKRIVIMSQDPQNEVADRGFRVVGLYQANLEMQEEAYVIAGRTTVQEMLGIGGQLSEIGINGDDYRDVDELLANVRHAIGAEGRGITVVRGRQLPWHHAWGDGWLRARLGCCHFPGAIFRSR